MTETWLPIPGFPGYEVSNTGRLKSFKTSGWPRRLKGSPGNSGHLSISLVNNGVRLSTSIHQLVMLAFVGPCPEGMEVCHNAGNPANNNLENLRYDTHAENCRDTTEHYRLIREELMREFRREQALEENTGAQVPVRK